jgi:hypothetical protein
MISQAARVAVSAAKCVSRGVLRNYRTQVVKLRDVNKRRIAGWMAMDKPIAITCFWAFWGIIKNFHVRQKLLNNLSTFSILSI